MSYQTEVLADSPYGYWKMGGTTGTITDETGGGHALTVTGTRNVTGAITPDDGAVSFNGTSQFGSVALALSGATSWTLEFWLKWNAYADDDAAVFEHTVNWNSANGGLLVLPNSSSDGGGLFSFGYGSSNRLRGTIVRPSAAAWHHYALVFAPSVLKAYVDGTSQTVTLRQTDAGDALIDDTLYFMSRAGASLFGGGSLDEVAIYKTEISSTRIAAHYSASGAAGPGTTYTKTGLGIVGP